MRHSAVAVTTVACLAIAAALPASAQFYEGKTLTLMVNYGAGGNTDIEARVFQRHLPKYLAGNPTIMVTNRPGAGGLVGINYLGSGAVKADGTTAGFFTLSPVAPIINDPALKVSYSDFAFIAGIAQYSVSYGRKDIPGVTKPADMAKARGVFAGGYGTTSDLDIRLKLVLDLMGTGYRVVTGFRSANDINLAMAKNEVNFSSSSMPGFQGPIMENLVKPGIAMPFWYYQVSAADGSYAKHPLLERQGIRAVVEVYKEVYGKMPSGPKWDAFVLVNNLATTMRRAIILPKGSPEAAIAELRKAFVAVSKDAAFQAEYESLTKVQAEMVPAEEGEKILAQAKNVDPATAAVLKEIAGAK